MKYFLAMCFISAAMFYSCQKGFDCVTIDKKGDTLSKEFQCNKPMDCMDKDSTRTVCK